jgi:hypothetical protein
VKQFICSRCTREYLQFKASFPEAKHGAHPLNDDGEMQDFAQVWIGANRSRALILMRYVTTAAAALLESWKHHGGSAANSGMQGTLPGRPDMAIAERTVRSASK